ncbi:MAG: FISUMP domain-containing protein, partial [Bacteroidota bacterium]
DGNNYRTVIIGKQEWMCENLKVSKYNDGKIVPNVNGDSNWKNLNSGAWCNLKNSDSLGKIYGKLYNWYAVVDSRNVCPVGWRIPNLNDIGNLLFNGKTSEEVQMMKEYESEEARKGGDNCANCFFGGIDEILSGSRSNDGSFSGLEDNFKIDGVVYLDGKADVWLIRNNSPGLLNYFEGGEVVNTWWGSVELGSEGNSIRCVQD